jgi:hypothetical protein
VQPFNRSPVLSEDAVAIPEATTPVSQASARPALTTTISLRQGPRLMGFAAGAVTFAGFFVDFFGAGGTSLSSASSVWFDLVPICVGIATLCLYLPVPGIVVSGLPLLAAGITFGLRGLASAANIDGYGAGFRMIALGSLALSLSCG